ncbi:MAG TPA: hypothetical protein VGE07_02270 [Herpetosiphonaceae bacterium]
MKRLGWLMVAAVLLAACGQPDTGSRGGATKTAAPTVAPAPHTVASILASPPPPGAKLTLNAYAGINELASDADCPTVAGSPVLTDRQVPESWPALNGGGPNLPAEQRYPADRPWLIASSGAPLPAYARLEGHLGDERYRDCPNSERIFVVDAVLADHQGRDWRLRPGSFFSIPLPEDFDGWPELEGAPGFSISYPPGSRIEMIESALPFERRIHLSDDVGTVVEVRVRDGELPYDPRDPEANKAAFSGYSQLFGPGSMMFGRDKDGGVGGYFTQQAINPTLSRTTAFFIGDGRTYEFAADFQLGFDASWDAWRLFHAMLYSYDGPGLRRGDATPTSPIKDDVVGADFLGRDALLELSRRDFGAGVSLIEAELVSEERAREVPGIDCNAIQGHPDAVWLATLAGAQRDAPEPVIAAYDARTGQLYCAYAVGSPYTPTPTPIIPTPTFTPAPPTTDPYLPPVPTTYPGPRRDGLSLTPTP